MSKGVQLKKDTLKLRTFAIGLFILIPLVKMCVVMPLVYIHLRNAYSAETRNRFQSLLQSQQNSVNRFTRTNGERINLMSSRLLLRRLLHEYSQSASEDSLSDIKTILHDALNAVPYIESVSVADPDGKVVYSTSDAYRGKNLNDKLFFRNGLTQTTALLRDDPSFKDKALLLTGPLTVEEVGTVGVLILEEKGSIIDHFLDLPKSMGKSAESIILASDRNGRIRYASKLADSSAAPPNRVVDNALRKAALVQRNTDTPSELFTLIDYRGKETLASVRKLPILNCYLLTKVDSAEVFGALAALQSIYIGGTLLSVAVALGVALFFAWYIASPLSALAQTAKQYSNGDITEPAPSSYIAELNELAENLSSLGTTLKGALRERDESVEELDYFSRYASHDLHAPSELLRKQTTALLEEGEATLPADVRELLDNLNHNAERMEHLITGMRDLSSIGASGLERDEVNLDQIVQTVIDELELHRKDGTYTIEKHDFPILPVARTLMLPLFRNLAQTMLNLAEGKQKKLIFTANFVQSVWVFGVQTTPRVLTPEGEHPKFYTALALKHLFHRDQRGVGLALTRKIIEAHSGRAWMEENDESGAHVQFILHAPTEKAVIVANKLSYSSLRHEDGEVDSTTMSDKPLNIRPGM